MTSIVTAGSYRWEAAHALREARLWAVRSRRLFDSLIGRGRFSPAQSSRVRETNGRSRFYSAATVLFAGMSVEGFLNQYAVVRLGKTASEKAFEGKPTVEKMRILLRAVGASEPGKRSEILRRVVRLATKRNDLAHPKTYLVERGDEHRLIEQGLNVATSCYEDMEFFFREFEKRDPTARSWTHV